MSLNIQPDPTLSATLFTEDSSSPRLMQNHIMLSVFSKINSAIIAIVEQESNLKPLYMRANDPTPQTCVDWERACKRFANDKDIPVDKIIKCALDGIEDVHYVNWIELERKHFEVMTLEEFMMLFHKTHLLNHWQDDICITFLRMNQDSQSFWKFQLAIQTTNVLLIGTPRYLVEKKLKEQIEAGMDQVLYVQSVNVKFDSIIGFRKWLAEVK
jgi:hypothetical protein